MTPVPNPVEQLLRQPTRIWPVEENLEQKQKTVHTITNTSQHASIHDLDLALAPHRQQAVSNASPTISTKPVDSKHKRVKKPASSNPKLEPRERKHESNDVE
jgi:hypothetical protein